MMLLAVSILSTLVIGAIGLASGRDSLEKAAFDQLVSVRESRHREIERTFDEIRSAVLLDSRNSSTVDASRRFNAAFAELQGETLPPDADSVVAAYYDDTFIPQLEERTQKTSDAAAFVPDSNAQRYLQYYYTAPFTDFDEAIKLDDAEDGSAWSEAHAKYHGYFREMTLQLGYEDALMLDTKGNVVYSAYSGVDLGTNVLSGPYAGGALTTAFQNSLRANVVDAVELTDFDRYQPSLGTPTAWAVSPIGDAGEITGALAVQLPIATINDVMTGSEGWKAEGLGNTGEVYLAGPDKTMRSASRLLIEHPDRFIDQVVSAGVSPQIAERAVAVNGTILLLPVDTTAVNEALRGQTGTAIATGYDGQEALVAYEPLDIEGVQWAIVAKIDSAEAFQPVSDFTRNVLLSIAGIVLAVCLLSLLLAQVFTRPVRGLVGAVRRVAAGETGIEVDASSRDEFGDLGAAFNDMSRNLQLKADLIEAQRMENEKLLHTLMPENVARRYREGEETIAEDHQDVSVVFADLVGTDAYFASHDSAEALAAVNGLVLGFDAAAAKLGIERVRTLRDGYLASCGLLVPRVDNVRRALDFAIEMRQVVQRFNSANGTSLDVRIGVDAGTVTSGLVGRENVAYDMWGDAVNIANAVRGASASPGIYVSDRVQSRLRDAYGFEQTDSDVDGTAVWRWVAEESRA
ncbi:HAMP domain-containing protein [Glaciihabitans arcticus]|uniref:HAMP domain-containing protein n=1 Tax=Glaciihabitans arcticus TaxID=2668039 RepID=A0A4Q9GMB0_9MICO|nr:HAMP domain-containing protein [Glaciihabitans arcticus]